jgi:uncharacterized protein (TIGR00725 family)
MVKDKKRVYRPVIKNIAFFGDAAIPKSDPVYKDAYAIAKILAKEGYTIVNGGGPGVMAASTRGAENVGGETIAVTFDPKDAPGFEGRYVGNIVDVEVKTENYIERMFKLLEHADVYIMFKGGSGTISEFGTAWVLAKLYYGHHKPFILFGSFWRDIIECVKNNLNIDKEELDVFRIIEDREKVLPTVIEFEKMLHEVDHGDDCKICAGRVFKK